MLLASLLLGAAIVVEVAATAALPRTQGLTNPGWTGFVLAGYAIAVWLLSRVVQTMPVSVAYAVWSGVGTALVATIGVLLLGENLGGAKLFGLCAIVLGVVLVNLNAGH